MSDSSAGRKKRPARRIGEKAHRGFAAMDPEKQRQFAKMGGQASTTSGKGHRWTAEEARLAGQKGGKLGKRGPTTKPKDPPVEPVKPSIIRFR